MRKRSVYLSWGLTLDLLRQAIDMSMGRRTRGKTGFGGRGRDSPYCDGYVSPMEENGTAWHITSHRRILSLGMVQ